MSGQLTEAQKAARSDQMLALNEKHAVEYEKSMIGNQLQVLLEEEVEKQVIQGKNFYLYKVYRDSYCHQKELLDYLV